jgi:cysteinyl-tRNA synthetase
MLRIYNTLAREKQDFQPIEPGKVRMYVCGMTTYDYCHIGHARMMMAFDVVQRWLRASGFQVTYVRNITDIEDKIIKRASERGISISALTEEFIDAMHEDTRALGIELPDVEPRATAYVPQMLDLIDKLQAKDLAYQSESGDVNFAVRRYPPYGRLSGKTLDQLRAGERVAVDAMKQDPLDFVLWKHARKDEPADAGFASRWGTGRPGWHIECSAMGEAVLGKTFDIHGGGADLQFPHHENEIAQSEGANGVPLANYWLHNGFLNVNDEKMSKSLGNFLTIREVLKRADAEVIRFFLLRVQYRSPFNYSEQLMEESGVALARLYTALREVAPDEKPIDWDEPYASRFREAMDDDFNTPIAVAILFELATQVHRNKSASDARQLKHLAGVLGLLQRDPVEFAQKLDHSDAIDRVAIDHAVEARAKAKSAKNYAEADRIRASLLDQGIILEDSASGTTWRKQ